MFKVGQHIVYGNHGVCLIETIGAAPLPELNPDRSYYTLMPLYEKVQMYVPVDTNVYMRELMDAQAVHDLILQMPDIKAPIISTSNSTELATEYRKLLNSHDPLDLMRLIKSIRRKSAKAEKEGRRTGLTDSRFLKQAEELLYGEFCVTLSIDRDAINQYVDDYIAKHRADAVPLDEQEDEDDIL